MNITELGSFIEEQNPDEGEPNYVLIKTPLPADSKWYGAFIYSHHDGDITEFDCTGDTLGEVEQRLTEYIVPYFDQPY